MTRSVKFHHHFKEGGYAVFSKVPDEEEFTAYQINEGSLAVMCDGVVFASAALLTNTFLIIPQHAVDLDTLIDEVKTDQHQFTLGVDGNVFELGKYACSAIEAKLGNGDFLLVQIPSYLIRGISPNFEVLKNASSGIIDRHCFPGDSGSVVNGSILLGGLASSLRDDRISYDKAVVQSLLSIAIVCQRPQTALHELYAGSKVRDESYLFVPQLEMSITYVPLSKATLWINAINDIDEIIPNTDDVNTVKVNIDGTVVQFNEYDRSIMVNFIEEHQKSVYFPTRVINNGASQCWVNKSSTCVEKDVDDTKQRIYGIIGHFAAGRQVNYDEKGVQYPFDTPICIFNYKTTHRAAEQKMEVCHHPLQCELLAHSDTNLKSGSHHTCMRPSHLMLSSKAMNTVHTGLNQIAKLAAEKGEHGERMFP